jgi:[ribosomal protein S5]-alanine N-acetyltransferase
MPGPRITSGDRVALRTLEREDISFWQRGYADPEIRYPTGNPKPKNREQVEELYENDDQTQFLVTLDEETAGPGCPADDDVRRIGVTSVKEWGDTPTIGYWLVPEVHGEGYGTEAVSLLVEYVFRTYDAPTVKAKVFDYNAASRSLLESLGFAEEGRTLAGSFVDGEYRDDLIYGLLREEWRVETDP